MGADGPIATIKAAVVTAPAEDLPRLLGQVAEVEAMIRLRLANPSPTTSPATVMDGNLDASEAARRLGVSKDWLYKNAGRLPFTRTIGRRVLFSAAGLDVWNRRRSPSGV